MLAPFAHHLRAPRVPLDRDIAHGTGLDVVKLSDVEEARASAAPRRPVPILTDQLLAVLLAGLPGVEVSGAAGAELLGAARTLGGGRVVVPAGLGRVAAHVTDGVAVRAGTPRTVRVQGDL